MFFAIIFFCFFDYNPVIASVPYSRYLYGTWIDQDKDCQNTRDEVLIEESLIPVIFDKTKCKVIKGKWYDPYSNQYIFEAKYLDVDHLVPLKEVHNSGGNLWSTKKREQYANDLSKNYTLIAVHRKVNRSKGAKNITEWLPPSKQYQCEYVLNWQKVKKDWSLTITEKEQQVITEICENTIKKPYYLQQKH